MIYYSTNLFQSNSSALETDKIQLIYWWLGEKQMIHGESIGSMIKYYESGPNLSYTGISLA